LHLQLSYLLIQSVFQCLILFRQAGTLIGKDLRQFRQRLALPGGDYVRMHFVVRGYFLDGFLSLDGFERYPCFELGRKLSAFSSDHCLLFPGSNDFTP